MRREAGIEREAGKVKERSVAGSRERDDEGREDRTKKKGSRGRVSSSSVDPQPTHTQGLTYHTNRKKRRKRQKDEKTKRMWFQSAMRPKKPHEKDKKETDVQSGIIVV
jgi:hypothetical protein